MSISCCAISAGSSDSALISSRRERQAERAVRGFAAARLRVLRDLHRLLDGLTA